MKIYTIAFLLLFAGAQAQSQSVISGNLPRITFMLRNTLGYHRMFLVEGPGIKYGFTMNRRETIPCNWPVGSRLYFSQDGETPNGLIRIVSAEDEGKTLGVDKEAEEAKRERSTASMANRDISFRLHNPNWLPRKIALISYVPGASGNGTTIFMLAPLVGFKSFAFPEGTRLFLADDEQVNAVMSGKRIDSSKPFLTLTRQDAGQVFDVK